MAVTKSWESPIALTPEALKPPVPAERRRELPWLVASSLFVAMALFLVYNAKSRDFPEASRAARSG